MDRRYFIKLGLNLAAVTAAQKVIPAWAVNQTQEIPEQFFIYIHFHNAWDTSLFADPFLGSERPDPSKYFIEYSKDRLIQVGDRFYGPALAPMKPFLSRMSVVNGLFMNASDIGHDGLASYMSSGGNGRGTSAGDIYTAISPNLMGIVTNSLNLPLPNGAKLLQFDSIKNLSGGSLADPQTVGHVAVSENPIESIFKSLGNQAFKFPNLKKEYETTSEMTGNEDWAVLAAAFISGASSAAQVSITSQLDTHSNHESNHLNALTTAFADVADLLRLLQDSKHPNSGKSLLDCTTIVIGSEFCRTPGLNSAKGKDHNPTSNSALIMGPGIQGGSIVGATRVIDPGGGRATYLAAIPVSVDTEQPVISESGTKLIRPPNIWKTVMVSMGIPETHIPAEFRKAKLLKSILKV